MLGFPWRVDKGEDGLGIGGIERDDVRMEVGEQFLINKRPKSGLLVLRLYGGQIYVWYSWFFFLACITGTIGNIRYNHGGKKVRDELRSATLLLKQVD